MVKPTRRMRAPVRPTFTGLTLAELEASTDALIGRSSGLGEHLSAYRRGRDTVAAIRAPDRSAAKQAAMMAAVSRGAVTDGRWRLVAVPDRQYRRLTAEAVRRASPDLWEASRPVAWSLSVTAGNGWPTPRVAAIRAATVGQLIASVRYDTQAANTATAAADAARLALIAVYDAIDAARPWGGVPLATADGWVIGYRAVPTFNATVCRAVADARGVDVSAWLSPVTVAGGLRVVAASADDGGDSAGDAYAP